MNTKWRNLTAAFVLGITLLLAVAVTMQAAPGAATAGDSSPDLAHPESSPIPISSRFHLEQIGAHPDYPLDGHYILTQNINSGGNPFNPIGGGYETPIPFTGIFDGQGYKITGLTISKPDMYHVGLFRMLAAGAVVKNLGLENVSVHGKGQTGALAGASENSAIENSYATGSVTADHITGGLIGRISQSNLSRCHANVSVTALYEVTGGLIGEAESSTLVLCHSLGNVEGGSMTGGLIGVSSGNTVVRSYSSGSVTGSWDVGGLIGSNGASTIENSYSLSAVQGKPDGAFTGGLIGGNYFSTIRHSYSAGQVQGDADVGGLIGISDESSCEACFWDTQASGQSGSAGGVGKSTAQMRQRATFADAGWDFANVWKINEGASYPYFLNQFTIAVAANPPQAGVVSGGRVYEMGETATITAAASVGYLFVNWTENEVEVSASAVYSFTVIGARNLTANFSDRQSVTELIPPEGGTLFSEIDQTTYDFPAGTFTSTVVFTHTHYATPPAPTPEGMAGIGYFFEITAVYSDTGQPVQPLVPITITIFYGPAVPGGEASGPFSLWRLTGGDWVELETADDPEAQTLTAQIDHFSRFAVFGEAGSRLFLPIVTR